MPPVLIRRLPLPQSPKSLNSPTDRRQVDPIPALAELARARGLPLHVDACFGGFMLPWLERLGHKVTPWDFRVEGVTSVSADLHK
jgi:glutamate/tyrosine decarboxylase-like PLP-dependent enzyme